MRLDTAVNRAVAGLADRLESEDESVVIRLVHLIDHRALVAWRITVPVVAIDAGRHRQQILERDATLPWLDGIRKRSSGHYRIRRGCEAYTATRVDRRAHKRRRDALAG